MPPKAPWAQLLETISGSRDEKCYPQPHRPVPIILAERQFFRRFQVGALHLCGIERGKIERARLFAAAGDLLVLAFGNGRVWVAPQRAWHRVNLQKI